MKKFGDIMNVKILFQKLKLIGLLTLIVNSKVECDVAQEKPKVIFQTGHSNWVYALDLSNDGKFLLTTTDDKSVKLWDFQRGKLLNNINTQKEGREVKFSPDGKYIVSGIAGRKDRGDLQTRNSGQAQSLCHRYWSKQL